MTRAHESRHRRRLTATEVDLEVVEQLAVLVGVSVDRGELDDLDDPEQSLDELALLTDTAGAVPVARVVQRRDAPDPATYLGRGKLEELRQITEGVDADVVVFDDELSPAQQRNLEQVLKVDVVDRVALILDIFALHATSREGMLQVELAQLRYRLPRLRGRGVELSRQGGGIGTRGPGEQQLEVDRRRILRRISKLEADLKTLSRTRSTQRKSRSRSEHPTVSFVGYTNAGKSTLLNRLTDANVLVENRLFSTLDPTVRRMQLPGGELLLLSDTVGFVRKLPHQLVEAFRSSLEEVVGADLLLHVVDGAAHDADRQIAAVRSVLRQIEADEIPELVVVNKIDVADPLDLKSLVRREHAVGVSARTGAGIDDLVATLADRLRMHAQIVEFTVPYDRGDVAAALHREGEVIAETHDVDGAHITARLPRAGVARYREFLSAS